MTCERTVPSAAASIETTVGAHLAASVGSDTELTWWRLGDRVSGSFVRVEYEPTYEAPGNRASESSGDEFRRPYSRPRTRSTPERITEIKSSSR